MAYKIILDAGGGGEDLDGVYRGMHAKNDNLQLTKEIGKVLENNSVEVIYTGITEIFQTPYEKVKLANETGADYFISFHSYRNDNLNIQTDVKCYLYERKGRELEMAENMNMQLGKIGCHPLGVFARPDLPLLSSMEMKSIAVILGYSHPVVGRASPKESLKKIAIAIATGILESLEESTSIYTHMYSIHIGKYKSRSNADYLLYQLQSKQYPAFLIKPDEYYRVLVGLFEELEKAVKLESRLRETGFNTYITTRGTIQ